nr:phospholipid carrier-dependent glycosyltransferase [Rhizohabitans arisaemae]
MRGSRLWGWLGPIAVMIFGGFLRFDRLDKPHGIIFDETYYAKEGISLLKFGVERVMLGTDKDPIANNRLINGNTDIFLQCSPETVEKCAGYVVHPPLGKWMIALGEWVFGPNPFGWRFAAALFGTLSILLLARTARRMTRSTLLGCLAGFLLALDGLHFVLSRFALLDVFLTFWIIAGFACLIADRDHTRGRLAELVDAHGTTGRALWLGLRPWRIAAAACLGLAVATKWSGVFFLVAFALLSLAWDAGARRTAGLPRPYRAMSLLDAPIVLGTMAITSIVAYTASWAGWFATPYGYNRNWAKATGEGPIGFLLESVRSWWDYHFMALNFHTGLNKPHTYMSEPWQWPLLARPVAFDYEPIKKVCGVEDCSRAVLGVGTPAIWWGGLVALVAMIAWYVATRDWRAGTVLIAYGVGWLPWFYFALADDRTMFLFYALPMLPFLILAIVLAIGLIIGPSRGETMRRAGGAAVAGAYSLLVLINFWWLYPILAAKIIPNADWVARMWFKSWI